jgi:hypothetical protein
MTRWGAKGNDQGERPRSGAADRKRGSCMRETHAGRERKVQAVLRDLVVDAQRQMGESADVERRLVGGDEIRIRQPHSSKAL